MPILKICAAPGCTERTPATRCAEHARSYQQARNRVPQRVAHRTPEYRQLRRLVLAEADGCYWCGGEATECDFLVPLVKGGKVEYGNAVAACKPCNSRRGGMVHR